MSISEECAWISAEVIVDIRSLEDLKNQARHAKDYGFDTRLAHRTLDGLKRTLSKSGQHGYLDTERAQTLENEVELIRRKLPAREYIRREEYEQIPCFEDIADAFSTAAIEAIVGCECNKRS